MKKNCKKLFSFLISLAMLVSMLPSSAFAADSDLTLRVASVIGAPGDTVDVKIDLEDNPGLASLRLKVAYGSMLTLQSVTYNSEMGGQYQQPQTMKSPVTLIWINGTGNYTGENVTFVTLSFKISDSAEENESADITVTFDPDDIYYLDPNNNMTAVSLNIINGSVRALSCTPGDIDGDGKVNNRDLTRFFQYLADWDVEVNEAALDTDGDGKVNNRDLTRLFQYLAEWDVPIYAGGTSTQKCQHTMEAVAYQAATCTDDGNIAYWYCTTCGKYFGSENGNTEISLESTVLSSPGHTVVVDAAVAPTETTTGLTEGSHCSVCGTVFVEQEVVPVLEVESRTISYNIANGDSYIATLNVTNDNPTSLAVTESKTLKNLSVDGYRFLGWYDLPSGSNAEIVKRIEPGEDDVELYAHWEKIEYTVQFKSSLYPIDSVTYTVDKGVVLPTPSLSNYVFAGWSDDAGQLYQKSSIPKGSVGDITLIANWTSERNKTVTKVELDDPIIYEDPENNMIYFAYEIGKIENVPLYTIHDFGYISGDGVTRTETKTYSTTVTETEMQSYSKAVAQATTESSNWTLSSGWSDSTSVNKEWCEENGYTEENATEIGQSETGTWNISSSSGGSSETTHLDTTQNNWQNEIKLNSSESTTNSAKIAAGLKSELGASEFGVSAKVSASIDTEEAYSETSTNGISIGGTDGNTTIGTDTTASSSNWNSSSSYGGSHTSSVNETTSRAISEKISQTTGYGSQYIQTENYSNDQGYSSTASSSNEYSVSATYSKAVGETVTSTWTTQATKPGYHRWVVAGTAHVFAVVGYDMAQRSYFVYTYSIMDDSTHEFEDYSYTTASYDDNQNGVISFEVPYEVNEYVAERTAASAGLKVDLQTGVITGYTGTDNCVVIPEYYNVGGGDVVKITGISSTAFKGNTDIAAVVLSDFITEIPDSAFEGCTSLFGVMGGSVRSIGANAFKGCTSIVECGISYQVESLGYNAFEGAEKLMVNPANAEVAEAAVCSGAKQIIIYANSLTNGAEDFAGKTLAIPEGTEYFEWNGYEATFENLTIVSDAAKTVINKTNFVSNECVPLKISSPEIVLNQVTVQSPGIALIMTAEDVELGLQGTIEASSVLCRDISLYESNQNVVGKLSVDGKMSVCSTINGVELLDCDDVDLITDEAMFDAMTKSYTIVFDANGGAEISTTKMMTYDQPFGDLPLATRENYSFLGWYTDPNDGEEVGADTIFTELEDIVLYAHWKLNSFTISFDGNGGTPTANNMGVVYDTAVGTLPTATRTGFAFAGWYTATSGGTQYTSNTIYQETSGITLYAHWTVNSYTATWSTGTGYTITVSRTSSPYGGGSTGTLSSGAEIYYGDVLSTTYAASTGYSLSTKGSTSITVTGDVTSSNIYATATANSYTYSIVYKSTNGTSLGSSSATYKYGTTNTISAPAKSGYTTPASQSVAWNATSKTITFTYTPSSVGYTTKSGTVSTSPGITYSATVEYQNRTATSVQLRVVWTSTIKAYSYDSYGQNFKATVGSVTTGQVKVCSYGTWSSSTSAARSASATSGWITVPLSTTSATSVSMAIYYWQTNSPGTDMYVYNGTPCVNTTWSISLPAY